MQKTGTRSYSLMKFKRPTCVAAGVVIESVPMVDYTQLLEELKPKAEETYKNIGEVFCPYFQGKISFNAKGLDHIKFKEYGKPRPPKEQYLRLKLLPLAARIIKQSNTLQEYFETERSERRKVSGQWEAVLTKIRYYGFVAIINNCRVKIIVKELEGGSKYFWSIIPFWKNNRADGSKNKKILHEGDVENQ